MGNGVVRMWEARVLPGMLDEALGWVRKEVVPSAVARGAESVAVCAADEPDVRVVVITRWATATAWVEPVPPPGLVSRSHAWPFRSVSLEGVLEKTASAD
jgi:hypothetical protein